MNTVEIQPYREELLIKEFVPAPPISEFAPDSARYAGTLVVRSENFGASLPKFDQFHAAMAADALEFDPPLVIPREAPQIIHYAGRVDSGTYGLEVKIPAGTIVSDEYTRRKTLEATR